MNQPTNQQEDTTFNEWTYNIWTHNKDWCNQCDKKTTNSNSKAIDLHQLTNGILNKVCLTAKKS
ncbi:MAG: hypothetical protein LBI79_08055 [Nitrososphaerota archaeon]|nr:hypothetical protein [Nitrososphaerota archaeon]